MEDDKCKHYGITPLSTLHHSLSVLVHNNNDDNTPKDCDGKQSEAPKKRPPEIPEKKRKRKRKHKT